MAEGVRRKRSVSRDRDSFFLLLIPTPQYIQGVEINRIVPPMYPIKVFVHGGHASRDPLLAAGLRDGFSHMHDVAPTKHHPMRRPGRSAGGFGPGFGRSESLHKAICALE